MRRLDQLTNDHLPVSLGQLTLCFLCGQGSTGRVFRAETRGVGGLPRVVAVTVLRPYGGLAEGDAWGDALPEVHRARLLRHRGVAQTFSCGERDGLPFVVTELVGGVGLGELLGRAGRLPARNVLDLGIQVAAAIGAAHRLDAADEGPFLHKDMRPSRVMIGLDGVVKVRGFGLSALVEPSGRDVLDRDAFAAPEVLAGRPASVQGDLFSLGATLACALTGRPPFDTRPAAPTQERIAAVVKAVAGGTLKRELDRIAPGLGGAIGRMVSIDPGARYPTATESEAAMREVRGGLPRGPRLGGLVQEHFGRDVGAQTQPGPAPEPLVAEGGARRATTAAARAAPTAVAPAHRPSTSAPRVSPSAPTALAPAHRPAAREVQVARPPENEVISAPPPAPSSAVAPAAASGRPAPPPVPVPQRPLVPAPRPEPGRAPAPPRWDETPTDPGSPEASLESLDVIPAVLDPAGASTGVVELEPTVPPRAAPIRRPADEQIGPGAPPSAQPRVAPAPEAEPDPDDNPTVVPRRPVAAAKAPVPPAPSGSGAAVPPPPSPAVLPSPGAMRVGQPVPTAHRVEPPPPPPPPPPKSPSKPRSGMAIRWAIRLIAFLVIVLALAFIGLRLFLEENRAKRSESSASALATEQAEPEPGSGVEDMVSRDSADVLEDHQAPTEPVDEPPPLVESGSKLEPDDARGVSESPPSTIRTTDPPAAEDRVADPVREPDKTVEDDPPRPSSALAAGSVVLTVEHRPVELGTAGSSDLVSVRVDGPSDTRVVLHAGPAGGPYTSTPLRAKSGGRWEGWLRFDVPAGQPLEYWIVASHAAADDPASAGSAGSPLVVEIR